jgi:hypothetical protein
VVSFVDLAQSFRFDGFIRPAQIASCICGRIS